MYHQEGKQETCDSLQLRPPSGCAHQPNLHYQQHVQFDSMMMSCVAARSQKLPLDDNAQGMYTHQQPISHSNAAGHLWLEKPAAVAPRLHCMLAMPLRPSCGDTARRGYAKCVAVQRSWATGATPVTSFSARCNLPSKSVISSSSTFLREVLSSYLTRQSQSCQCVCSFLTLK